MGNCSGEEQEKDNTPPSLALDFSANPEPKGEDERKLYDEIKENMAEGPKLLEVLSEYRGCEEEIRKALNDPGPKTEEAAWKAVSKAVNKLHAFYQFSNVLHNFWPSILEAVCKDDAGQGIQDHLALTKEVAVIFKFVFYFDESKMINPAIQNDFSYYRRVLSRMKNQDRDKKNKIKVDEEMANKMSFFFAYPTPMMKVLIDATTEFERGNRPKLINGLSMIANLSIKALQSQGNLDAEPSMLYLCAMTGCIILVDHLHDNGAFHKKISY